VDIQKLRQATEADHRAVEDAVPLLRKGLSIARYVQCLVQIYGIVATWEERAVQVAPSWLQSALIARQRKPLLELDLAWFGQTQPGQTEKDNQRPTLPAMNNLPSLLGTMYVMEGSTLGGIFIARHVEAALHLSEGRGNSYFRGNGNRTGPMWNEFCEVLKQRIPNDQTDAVVVSAKAMFATFAAWMRRNPAMIET
jgi:heme oxygenase